MFFGIKSQSNHIRCRFGKLLQVPEVVASLSVTVPPMATDVVPVMAATVGEPITATADVATLALPQLLVAVKVYTPAVVELVVIAAGF